MLTFKNGPDFEGIPCGVPYWDSSRFLAAGGKYTEANGYYVTPDQYLDDFEEWLPRKWQYRGTPLAPVILPCMLPTTAWEANLRTELTDKEWGRLRKFTYQAAGYTCVACGSRGEPHLEAHEAWHFEKNGIQRLVGLLCLCPTCHKIKHLGFANRLGVLPQVISRLRWLNDWSEEDVAREIKVAKDLSERLSTRKWTLDLSFLRDYGVR